MSDEAASAALLVRVARRPGASARHSKSKNGDGGAGVASREIRTIRRRLRGRWPGIEFQIERSLDDWSVSFIRIFYRREPTESQVVLEAVSGRDADLDYMSAHNNRCLRVTPRGTEVITVTRPGA